MLIAMKSRLLRTAAPLITKIQKLFSEDLAKENDFLRQENKILRSKLGKRITVQPQAARASWLQADRSSPVPPPELNRGQLCPRTIGLHTAERECGIALKIMLDGVFRRDS